MGNWSNDEIMRQYQEGLRNISDDPDYTFIFSGGNSYPEFDINTLTLNAYDYDFLKLCKVKVD